MMTSFREDIAAAECASHFKQLMHITVPCKGWIKLSRSLLDEHNLTPDELKAFMVWAATKNVSDTPQFSSVDYLAKAKDPLVSLVKNAPGLIKVWHNHQTRRTGRKVFWKGELNCHICRGDGYVEPVQDDKPGAKKLTPCPNCKCGYYLMPERRLVSDVDLTKYEKFTGVVDE